MECPHCHFLDNDKNADLCLKCGSSLSIKDEISDDEDTIDYNFRPGKKFENFQVIEKIGTGGHGDVYKVKELGTNKIWALKTLTSIKRKSLPRFQQEFRVLSNLEHENIVKVYKYGIYGEMHYYVMEIIDGVDMRKYIRNNLNIQSLLRGNKDIQKSLLNILEQICSALSYIHDKKIIHRDIKPSNVFVTQNGKVKLMDFGLIKETNIQRNLTATGIILGSASYMSPEQCLGQKVDFTSDLYSLGIILYEIFSGKPPFTGNSMIEIITKKSKGIVLPPRKSNPSIHPSLEKVILKLLQKNPVDRYSSATQFLEDIKTALSKKPSKFSEVDTSTAPTRPSLKIKTKKSKTKSEYDHDSEVTVKKYFDEISSFDEDDNKISKTEFLPSLKKYLKLILLLCLITAFTILTSSYIFKRIENENRQKQITSLLQRAQINMEKSNLTTPVNDNAYDNYKELLKLDPTNQIALSGIKTIKEKYLLWADNFYKSGKLEESLNCYEKILFIEPENETAKIKANTIKEKLKK